MTEKKASICSEIYTAANLLQMPQKVYYWHKGFLIPFYESPLWFMTNLKVISYFSRSYVLTTTIAIKEVQILARNFNAKNKATRQGWKKNL